MIDQRFSFPGRKNAAARHFSLMLSSPVLLGSTFSLMLSFLVLLGRTFSLMLSFLVLLGRVVS